MFRKDIFELQNHINQDLHSSFSIVLLTTRSIAAKMVHGNVIWIWSRGIKWPVQVLVYASSTQYCNTQRICQFVQMLELRILHSQNKHKVYFPLHMPIILYCAILPNTTTTGLVNIGQFEHMAKYYVLGKVSLPWQHVAVTLFQQRTLWAWDCMTFICSNVADMLQWVE